MDFCNLRNPKDQYLSVLQPKDCTHHNPYSTDFGVIKIDHPIASGKRRPPASEIYVYIQNHFTASSYNADVQMLHSSTTKCQIMRTDSTLIGA